MLDSLLDTLARVDAGELAPPRSDVLTGFSGTKVVAALAECLRLHERHSDICYLEVGVFQGLTLLSTASAHPAIPCFGIDNFSLDPGGQNRAIIGERAARLGLHNHRVLDQDFEVALAGFGSHLDGRRVALYFIDGPHDYRSQLLCLLLAQPHLHERAVIVVDDSNYRHVRQASRDFLASCPDWKLACEAYTRCHPANMTPEEQEAARDGWWNGVNILVRDPEDRLPRRLPTVDAVSRELHLYEHLLWTSRIAEQLDVALRPARALYNRNVRGFARTLARAVIPRQRPSAPALFDELNTYSENLPAFTLNRTSDGR